MLETAPQTNHGAMGGCPTTRTPQQEKRGMKAEQRDETMSARVTADSDYAASWRLKDTMSSATSTSEAQCHTVSHLLATLSTMPRIAYDMRQLATTKNESYGQIVLVLVYWTNDIMIQLGIAARKRSYKVGEKWFRLPVLPGQQEARNQVY